MTRVTPISTIGTCSRVLQPGPSGGWGGGGCVVGPGGGGGGGGGDASGGEGEWASSVSGAGVSGASGAERRPVVERPVGTGWVKLSGLGRREE